MDTQAYQNFTRTLLANLEADPAVIGLVALGSTARQEWPNGPTQPHATSPESPSGGGERSSDARPDLWSDHDIFIITLPGEQERLRQSRNWLPDPDQVVLHFRETEHAVKVLYRNGHLMECAIFDLQELQLAQVNDYRVLFDRSVVADAVTQVAQASARRAESAPEDAHWMGQFLTHLLVGVGRHRRGEALSGSQFVKSYALADLLHLLTRYISAPNASRLDPLDPFRRFEAVYSELGRELGAILTAETPKAALGLLEIAGRELNSRMTGYPTAAAKVVYQFISGESAVQEF